MQLSRNQEQFFFPGTSMMRSVEKAVLKQADMQLQAG